MIYITFIIMNLFSVPLCSVDGGQGHPGNPGRDYFHQDRNISAEDKGEQSDKLCTDLQLCFSLRGQVDPKHTKKINASFTLNFSFNVSRDCSTVFTVEIYLCCISIIYIYSILLILLGIPGTCFIKLRGKLLFKLGQISCSYVNLDKKL